MGREGQTRVEIRPGVFVWMDEKARKAHEAWTKSQAPAAPDTSDKVQPLSPTGIESASVEPGEKAVQPQPKARKV